MQIHPHFKSIPLRLAEVKNFLHDHFAESFVSEEVALDAGVRLISFSRLSWFYTKLFVEFYQSKKIPLTMNYDLYSIASAHRSSFYLTQIFKWTKSFDEKLVRHCAC
jgi:hypothetical protein